MPNFINMRCRLGLIITNDTCISSSTTIAFIGHSFEKKIVDEQHIQFMLSTVVQLSSDTSLTQLFTPGSRNGVIFTSMEV